MAVKASPDVIREMIKEINDAVKALDKVSGNIRSGIPSGNNWDDDKATEFTLLIQKVARLTETPITTLKAAVPKLEKLADALDSYSKVKI